MKHKIIVEKNIPIPPRPPQARKPGYYQEILKNMQIGDSALLTNVSARNHFLKVARQLGLPVISRKDGTGIRVWIVKPDDPRLRSKPVQMFSRNHINPSLVRA